MPDLLPDQPSIAQWRTTFANKVKRVASMVQRQYHEQTTGRHTSDLQRDQLFHVIELNFHYLEKWREVIDCLIAGDEEMQRRGPWEMWATMLKMGLSAADHLSDRQAEADLSFRLASLRTRQGWLQEAETLLQRAEYLYRQQNETAHLPQIWRLLAEQQIVQGDYTTALVNLQRAQQQQQATQDLSGLAETYCSWGRLADIEGDMPAAIAWYEKVLALPHPSVFIRVQSLLLV